MDDTTCYCCNPRCPLFGATAPRSRLKLHAWQRHRPRFCCDVCGAVVSASTGTAYAGRRADLHSYLRGATAFAEGLSIRATARLLGVDQDTGNHWWPVLGRPCPGVMNHFFRSLHRHECQLDKVWTFIYKQEAHLTPLEQLRDVAGEAWGWMAFSPVCKLVPAWVVGKRPLRHARRLIVRLKSAIDGHSPFLTSDERPH